MMGYCWGGMLDLGALWTIVGFLFWVGIVFLAVWAVIRLFPDGSRTDWEGPLEILGRRYTAGELTREQYEEMRRKLDE